MTDIGSLQTKISIWSQKSEIQLRIKTIKIKIRCFLASNIPPDIPLLFLWHPIDIRRSTINSWDPELFGTDASKCRGLGWEFTEVTRHETWSQFRLSAIPFNGRTCAPLGFGRQDSAPCLGRICSLKVAPFSAFRHWAFAQMRESPIAVPWESIPSHIQLAHSYTYQLSLGTRFLARKSVRSTLPCPLGTWVGGSRAFLAALLWHGPFLVPSQSQTLLAPTDLDIAMENEPLVDDLLPMKHGHFPICSMAMLNLPSGIWVCLKWCIPLTVDFNGENGDGPLNFGGIFSDNPILTIPTQS